MSDPTNAPPAAGAAAPAYYLLVVPPGGPVQLLPIHAGEGAAPATAAQFYGLLASLPTVQPPGGGVWLNNGVPCLS